MAAPNDRNRPARCTWLARVQSRNGWTLEGIGRAKLVPGEAVVPTIGLLPPCSGDLLAAHVDLMTSFRMEVPKVLEGLSLDRQSFRERPKKDLLLSIEDAFLQPGTACRPEIVAGFHGPSLCNRIQSSLDGSALISARMATRIARGSFGHASTTAASSE